MAVKIISVKDLRTKSDKELNSYIKELRGERLNLIEQLHTGKTKETHKMGQLKRAVATALTIQLELKSTKEENK